jgi:hypothetical protein|tara:strand:+ start:908 stop:1429 length:522 start_codon:yes stop_codon:yes gene_type:complete
MRNFDIQGKNSLERQLHPIEEKVMELNQFSSSTNVEKRCLAYASRLMDKGYGPLEVERSVDNWIDTGKGFPSFSDLRIMADSFKPRQESLDKERLCSKSTCDGSMWVTFDDKGQGLATRCLCHPSHNGFVWENMLRHYKISDQYKSRYKAFNSPKKEGFNKFEKPYAECLKSF